MILSWDRIVKKSGPDREILAAEEESSFPIDMLLRIFYSKKTAL